MWSRSWRHHWHLRSVRDGRAERKRIRDAGGRTNVPCVEERKDGANGHDVVKLVERHGEWVLRC